MTEDRSEREYPQRPLAGVGAVVWDGARVLLAQRGKPPAQGVWSLPGGMIELGETAVQAVAREVREECGIEVEVGEVLGVFDPIFRDPDGRIRYHYVVVDFLAHYRGGELRASDDAADVRWVAPADLADYPLSEAARGMIRRALAHVGHTLE
jgi:ADP-ribose pyrophosphatase